MAGLKFCWLRFGLTPNRSTNPASWLGSLGRLGWLVIGTFHASLLIGADLYLAGPSVESVCHGGADGRHFIPENSRHSRCDDEGSRDDGHGHGVFHFAEYALRSTRFPAQYCAIRNVRHGLPPANLSTPAIGSSWQLFRAQPVGLFAGRQRVSFDGTCPSLPAADRQTPARNAGTSITAISTPARSRSALAIPMMRIRGSGIAVSIRDRSRASNRMARPPPSTRPAPISSTLGGCFFRTGPKQIFRPGVTNEIGPRENMRCGRPVSGFLLKNRVR